MDIVVIGKASHNNGDKPNVVYCGNCRVEAEQAVAKSDLVRFYEIDAHHIMRPIAKTANVSVVAQPAPAPEVKTQSPKKSK